MASGHLYVCKEKSNMHHCLPITTALVGDLGQLQCGVLGGQSVYAFNHNMFIPSFRLLTSQPKRK